MSIIGNILWLIFGGIFIFLEYLLSGILLCCTIIGIPFGLQVFKISFLALMPFGRTTVPTPSASGCLSVGMNILWIFIGGIWIALSHALIGALLCCTIIGIPFGLQHFKLAAVALTPFGRQIVSV